MKPIFAIATSVIVLTFANSANAEALSAYTGVNIAKDCVIASSSELEKEPEIDHLDAECPALGGYRIFVSGGDIRYGITLGFGKAKIDLDKTGAFHDLGSEKIEWVYERVPTKVDGFDKTELNYLALIHRIDFQTYDQKTETEKQTTKLIVTKLAGEKSCIVAEIAAADDMNAKAKAIATKAQTLECIKED